MPASNNFLSPEIMLHGEGIYLAPYLEKVTHYPGEVTVVFVVNDNLK